MKQPKVEPRGFLLNNLLGLSIVNAFVILTALYQEWDIGQIIWIYIGQSIIIGIFTVWRVLRTELYTMRSTGDAKTKAGVAIGFAFGFGFMHIIYVFFLLTSGKAGLQSGIFGIVFCLAAFLFDRATYYRNIMKRQQDIYVELGSVIGIPFLRVVVMHIVLIVGMAVGMSNYALVLFIVLKSLSDILFEHCEFRILENQAKQATNAY